MIYIQDPSEVINGTHALYSFQITASRSYLYTKILKYKLSLWNDLLRLVNAYKRILLHY